MKKKRANRKIKPRTKEKMKEIADIVKNSETDEAALEFLQDALEDDFPELELGKMDLHEASKILGGDEPEREPKGNLVENLNASLGKFIDKQEKNHNKRKRKRRKNKKRRGRK